MPPSKRSWESRTTMTPPGPAGHLLARQPQRLSRPEKAIPQPPPTRRKIRLSPTESDSVRLNQAILKHFLFHPISRRLMFGVPPSGGQGLAIWAA